MGLKEYHRKRDFSRTPEPSGGAGDRPARARPGHNQPRFVIQKHHARRAHYDFRLEMDGVLKSWAVPKGPSLDPADKRLAVHVEDHPIEYGDFEGVIPAGEYGGGTVMLWDRGTWEPYTDAHAGYAKGDFKFVLHGEKLHGRWVLVRMKRRDGEKAENWLLIKERDEDAVPGSGEAFLEREGLSVATGRDMDEIAKAADRVWSSKTGEVTKKAAPAAKQNKQKKPTAKTVRTGASSVDPSTLAGAKRAKTAPDVEPQLARLADTPPAGDEWLHEIKFDGYRILTYVKAGTVRLLSRNGLDWTRKFPELAAVLAELPVNEAVIDGEVAHIDADGVSRFGHLQDDLSTGKTAALAYMAFDLPYLDGWDLRNAPLEARKALLQALLADDPLGPTVHYTDHFVGQGADFFQAADAHGLEGIISKRRDAPYRGGRGPTWLKIKTQLREDFVVVGFSDPEGTRVGFGSLLLGYRTPKGKLVYAGRVGTGYSDKVLAALHARLKKLEQKAKTVALPPEQPWRDVHWVKPELVVEVGFSEWTRDKLVRAASFIGVRDDKAASEVELDPVGGARTPQRAAAAAAPKSTVLARDGSATVAGVRITHAERVVYPQQGLTKLAVAEYYAAVAEWVLPHVGNRPLSLLRCPEGITGEKFFQKHPWGGVTNEIQRIEIAEQKGGSETHMWVKDVKGLLGLVQMGVLEIHPWGAGVKDVERPDRLTFDLDPDEGLGWQRVVEASFEVRDALQELGLQSFLKTTGGKGLHVVVPIKPALDWDDAKAFCKAVVEQLAGAAPQRYTATLSKKARHGRIFIDYLRNGRGATAVGAYSTRARPGATVSTPVTWKEAERGIRADQFTIETVPQRLRKGPDPWADFLATRQSISAAVRRKLKV
ncbi:MAG: DNA ligase D [Alphaproteobacteria bacterium]|nr:DNA ligase D [Alphaproteobacteria bacterium]